ncbi:MAG: acetoin utilization protein AcuC [Candidatus Bathyarchaeota archaeon]|nr:acetoin utilization protein AcuC [Candidatus Bathyarchaeota archaeon]
MNEVAIIYDDSLSKYDFGKMHPLKPERLKLTFELLRSIGYLEKPNISVFNPKVAKEEELVLFHSESYIETVKKYSDIGSGLLDSGDTPAFKECFESTCIIVGASLKALELVADGKTHHAFNMSGGLHHAFKNRASGFCIFNDPAICIEFLKKEYDMERILYLDIDAHHGDGVMYGFYSDSTVLDIDFHEDGNHLFPGTGFVYELGKDKAKGLKINFPLPPGTGDTQYIRGFRELVPALIDKFKPEIMLMQCGADSHYDDRLTHLNLSTNMYSEVANTIHKLAHKYCNGKLIMFGGGGYNLFNVSRCWTVILNEIIDEKSNIDVPNSWRILYKKIVGEPIPTHLYDEEMPSDEIDDRIIDEVTKNIEYFKSNIL